jgi:hypothetical protein
VLGTFSNVTCGTSLVVHTHRIPGAVNVTTFDVTFEGVSSQCPGVISLPGYLACSDDTLFVE